MELVQTTARVAHRSKHELEILIKGSVPGFTLRRIYENGSTANDAAISEATDDNKHLCAFGVCCYVGGSYSQSNLSSSIVHGNQLSFPIDPAMAPERCLKQAVALPYHIPDSSIPEDKIRQLEIKCYRMFEEKLLFSELAGCGIKALLMELVLQGNGATLSEMFIKKLAGLCHEHGIKIIVDEIMTGGRVGPQMTMTQSYPQEFIDAVHYITLGKVFRCGVVLTKISRKPKEGSERGYSFTPDPSCLYSRWSTLSTLLQNNCINTRREKVMRLLRGKSDNTMDHQECIWGAGLMIFSSRNRSFVQRGLNNRCLPKIVDTRLYLGPSTKSKWTRTTVSERLMTGMYKWIDAIEKACCDEDPFLFWLARYGLTNTDHFTEEEFINFIGDKADTLTEQRRAQEEKENEWSGGKCKKKTKTFAVEAIHRAMKASRVTKVRKGHRRKMKYEIKYTTKQHTVHKTECQPSRHARQV